MSKLVTKGLITIHYNEAVDNAIVNDNEYDLHTLLFNTVDSIRERLRESYHIDHIHFRTTTEAANDCNNS